MVFPPIEIQKIKEKGNSKIILIDGYHRLQAHINAGRTEIECNYWKPNEVLDKDIIDEWVELKLHAAEANSRFGDRLNESDNKEISRAIIKKNSKITEATIAKRLGVSQASVSGWVDDLKCEYISSQNNIIFRLNLLGWTRQEIGDHPKVQLARTTVNDRVAELSELIKLSLQEFNKKKPIKEIAEYHKLDQLLVWALVLNGMNDIERFATFGKSEYGNEQPKFIDYWKFAEGDKRLGQSDYNGNLYGQEAMNIIYRYSKQGDLIVDPMAGGGVTIDASLILNRKCRAYDADPSKSGRDDVQTNDARLGFPDKVKGCQLVLLDPPYYNKEQEAYETDKYFKTRPEFLDYIETVCRKCLDILKPSGYMAFLYGQYIDYEDELDSILTFHLAERIKGVGFEPIVNIQSPLTFNNQWTAWHVEKAKEYDPWRILPVSRDWMIFKKV